MRTGLVIEHESETTVTIHFYMAYGIDKRISDCRSVYGLGWAMSEGFVSAGGDYLLLFGLLWNAYYTIPNHQASLISHN